MSESKKEVRTWETSHMLAMAALHTLMQKASDEAVGTEIRRARLMRIVEMGITTAVAARALAFVMRDDASEVDERRLDQIAKRARDVIDAALNEEADPPSDVLRTEE